MERGGERREIRRASPASPSWEGPGSGRRDLVGLLVDMCGREGARSVAEGVRRSVASPFLLSVRPVGARGRRAAFPADFTMFAVLDELAAGVEDAPFLFTPSADLAERLSLAGVDGRAVLRALAARANASAVGSPAPVDGLPGWLAAAGSPGPWMASLRRDRRPMACVEWGHHETDVAELYDASGRRLACLWRQCRVDGCGDPVLSAAFEAFAWAVCAASGDVPAAAGEGRGAAGLH